ncbi:TonB-dependent receptor plug domain-containing protein, partial [Gemmatimonadota bacterium]
ASEGDGNDEADGWSMWSGALRIDRELKAGKLSATVRGSRSDFDIDDWGGPGGDDPNATSWKNDLTGAITWRGQFREGWEQQLTIGSSRIHRGLRDRKDPGITDDETSSGDYLGISQNVEWHHTLLLRGQQIAAGLTLERQQGRSRYESVSTWGTFTNDVPQARQSSVALYLQDQIMVAGVALTIGGRVDAYTDYGVQPTGRMAAATRVGNARLRFSVGTGFRAPSIYQRFSPDFGNSALEAETSTGWDAGLEVPVMQRGAVEITHYRQKIDNLIEFVTDEVTWVSNYRNRGSVRLEGWEAEARLALSGSVGLDASATIMDAVDELTGEDLVRRPDMSLSVGVMVHPVSGISTSVRARRIGTRKDRDLSAPPYPVIDLDPVTLVEGEVSWQFSETLMLRLKVRNLTDASPVWVWGYGSMGRSIYLGFVFRR